MTFNQLFLILCHRWKWVFVPFLIALILAIAVTFLSPSQYLATSSLVIDPKADAISSTAYSDQMLASYVSTQMDVTGSPRVAQRVAKILRLDEDQDLQALWRSKSKTKGDSIPWIASYLLEKKVVVGSGKSKAANLIYITARWSTPTMAAAIANAFAQAAIDTNIELRIAPAKQFAKWFDQHSLSLRSDLEAKQQRLSDFENATGIIASDEKLDVEMARLKELSSQLVEIEGLRQDSQSRQRQIGGSNDALQEVLQSPVIASLKSDLSDAETKQAEVAARLGQNHPDYQSVASQVNNLRNRIHLESRRIADALGSNTQINTRREADIRDALDQQKTKVLELKHNHDQASVLQNDVTTAQRDLDSVTQRLALSNLESQQQQTNMVQLTVADAPLEPFTPKIVFNLLSGTFGGMIIGICAALLAERKDRRIREDFEITDGLDVPILAKISSVTLSELKESKSTVQARQLEHSPT